MENKITFIIPSLNRPTISRSVESLLTQTNPNWTCIIIYDGVDGVEFNDERIKCLKIKKTGSINSSGGGESGLVRNFGIEESKTEWVGFLDDDDTLHQDYVKDLFEKYSEYDFVVWRMVYTNGVILPPPNSNDLSNGNVGISFCFKNKFGNLLFGSNNSVEDYEMIVKLKSLTSNFIVAPEVYYNIRH
jgi:glycosyltransferase involved in cell wall biosynthesis